MPAINMGFWMCGRQTGIVGVAGTVIQSHRPHEFG